MKRRGGGGRRRPQEPPTKGPSSWKELVARLCWRNPSLWPSLPAGIWSKKDFDFPGSIMKVSPQTRSPRGVLHKGQSSCRRNFFNSCTSLQVRVRFKDGIDRGFWNLGSGQNGWTPKRLKSAVGAGSLGIHPPRPSIYSYTSWCVPQKLDCLPLQHAAELIIRGSAELIVMS